MRVEKLLQRLKREFIKVNLLQAALDSLTFFLSANLFLFLLSLQVTGSFSNLKALTGLTILFFIGDLVYRARNYNVEIYEQKNPELQEILRTARDNLDQQNIVSQAMFDELMDRSRSVTSESIIPSKRIIQKILAVGVLSFLTVISGIADFQLIQDGGEILPEIEELEELTQNKKGEDKFELKNSSDIYGEKKDIKVSDQLVDFNITGTGENSNSDLRSSGSRPEEAVLDVSGGSLSEDMELAKQYSLAIKDFS